MFRINKKLLLIPMIGVLLTSFFITLVANTALAASTYKWGDKNHSTITTDTSVTYTSIGYSCAVITLNNDFTLADSSKPSGAPISTSYSNESFSGVSTVTGCSSNTGDYPPHHVWVSSDKKSLIIVKDGGDNRLTAVGDGWRGKGTLWDLNGTSMSYNSDIASITKPDDTARPETDQTNDAVTSNTEVAEGNDCGDAGFVLGWIICPIGSALAAGTQVIDNTLYSLLYIDTGSWEESGVKTAWENFRVISSVMIVLVALIGIASQVFSFDFLSAYTIRKIIPKLFIAVILIQLSWFLATMAINISNTVGFSVQALLSAPFENIAEQKGGTTAVSIGEAGGSGDGWIGFADVVTVYANNSSGAQGEALLAGATLAGGGIVAAIFSAPVLLSFAGGAAGAASVGVPAVLTFLIAVFLPAFLAILTAFVVIILRVVLLLALTMVLPLALVAWILPSTKKWFDRWWGMFFALLAFFPIIITFITAGKIASLILATSAGYSGIRNIVLLIGVIVAYFIPYFLIFKLLKFSGGALGKIQGAIDNVRGGVNKNEALQGWRNKQKESGKVYSDERARRRTENARSEIASLEGKPGFRNRMRRTRASLQQNAAQGQLGTSGYFGEAQERKLDETIDKSKAEADSAVVRQMRGLTADESTKYLEELGSKATQDQFAKNNGEAEITVGGKTFRVTDSMWAASLPRQKDFKNNIDDILKASNSSDPHLSAIARRVVSDNGAMVDSIATDFSRTGLVLDDYHSASSRGQVRDVMKSKLMSDQVELDKIRTKVLASNPNATQADIDTEVDKKIDENTDNTLSVIRAKQTASYKDLHSQRKKKVKETIEVLSGNAKDANGNLIASTDEQKREAIGLAMQLVSQSRDLTGADIIDLTKSTGLDIEAVAKSGGNQTFELQEVLNPATNVVEKKIVVASASGSSAATTAAAPAPRIVLKQTSSAPGAAPVMSTPTEVTAQITSAGGLDKLTPDEVNELWQHANANWIGDPQGTQIGIDAQEELRRRGYLPPRP